MLKDLGIIVLLILIFSFVMAILGVDTDILGVNAEKIKNRRKEKWIYY